jgi:cell shape-determining protein MreC
MDFLTAFLSVSAVAGVVGLPIYVVFRFLRAYEQRTEVQADTRQLLERIEELEARVESLEAENEQLVEGQRFTSAVLAARPTDALPAPRTGAT